MSHGTKTNSCTPPTLTPPPYHLLGTSFDASFGYRLAIVWLLSGPKREETMGKRLPNDMPNEQWGRGGMEMKGRGGLALCHEHLSRSNLNRSDVGPFSLCLLFMPFTPAGPSCKADMLQAKLHVGSSLCIPWVLTCFNR